MHPVTNVLLYASQSLEPRSSIDQSNPAYSPVARVYGFLGTNFEQSFLKKVETILDFAKENTPEETTKTPLKISIANKTLTRFCFMKFVIKIPAGYSSFLFFCHPI